MKNSNVLQHEIEVKFQNNEFKDVSELHFKLNEMLKTAKQEKLNEMDNAVLKIKMFNNL